MSNPNQLDRDEDKVSRVSFGPGLVVIITFVLILVAAVVTYILLGH